MTDDKIKKIAQLTGIDPALIESLGVENLSQEKLDFLEGLVDMYSSDQEAFGEFVNQSGLANVLNNLTNNNKIDDEEDIEQLKKDLSELFDKDSFDLDL
ncbi:hypothetical protein [Halonatronum saccharophilum]|uniref:hypothetical protein n=1 Tax=Halonatronum saccharophilum TaxID=150060 RepID=UPI0004855187|nr:hypothetical protein [Halonatronum saccharophilum]